MKHKKDNNDKNNAFENLGDGMARHSMANQLEGDEAVPTEYLNFVNN